MTFTQCCNSARQSRGGLHFAEDIEEPQKAGLGNELWFSKLSIIGRKEHAHMLSRHMLKKRRRLISWKIFKSVRSTLDRSESRALVLKNILPQDGSTAWNDQILAPIRSLLCYRVIRVRISSWQQFLIRQNTRPAGALLLKLGSTQDFGTEVMTQARNNVKRNYSNQNTREVLWTFYHQPNQFFKVL